MLQETDTRPKHAEHHFGVLAHAYQPPRLFNVEMPIGGVPYAANFTVAPEYNGIITDQVYEPILAEEPKLFPGLITSIYAPLRSFLKQNRPEVFSKIRADILNTPDKEYSVLGDPLIHAILPLLPAEDQEMLIKAGKQAFEDDFGFSPKGLWLPETAVTKETLKIAAHAGYEFVPLRDYQVGNLSFAPGSENAEHSLYLIDLGDGQSIFTVVGNSELSGQVAYDKQATVDGHTFMQRRQGGDRGSAWNALMMMDLETYGHHLPFTDKFLKWVLENQKSYGFEPLNVRELMESQGDSAKAEVYDGSSWSCSHNLGRWTGNCSCDNPSQESLADKKLFHTTLVDMNKQLNDNLTKMKPDWRKDFIWITTSLRDEIFSGQNFGPALAMMVDSLGQSEDYLKHMLGKLEVLVGFTSCGWFFGGDKRPERDIPANMIQGVRDLFAPPSLS